MTIQEAVDAASGGDLIKVGDGTYGEFAVTKSWLTIESENGPEVTRIENSEAPILAYVHPTGGSITNVVLKGFTLHTFNTAVQFESTSLSRVQNCMITGSRDTSTGMHLRFSNFNVIENCEIENCYYGIYVYSTAGTTIMADWIENNSYGVYLEGPSSPYSMISWNYIENNDYGIYLYDLCWWWDWDVGSFSKATFNNICGNAEYGIYAEPGDRSQGYGLREVFDASFNYRKSQRSIPR
jgi:parallel beta-helix repeat protein